MRNLETTAQPFDLMSAGAEKFGQFFRKASLTAAMIVAAFSSAALAQQQQIITHGQLAVTGYSGSEATAGPEGADPFDYLGIKLDGPSAQIIEARVLGPQGQVSNATKPFAVTAGQVGQVFGVTLDNAPRPNIYVAATSAYGLTIAVSTPDGQLKRVRKGEAGAQWMPGQFGPPELGGGPGSIWRVDGTTGAVSRFANVESAGFGAASLGALAFDPRTNQIFAVDRGTGLVYRFGLDGVQRGVYDHGTEGRGPVGLPPIPSPGFAPVNTASPAFDTENPVTWGYATPARRVYALAVRDNRLYYSVAQGPQIWSVGISASGSVAASPRIEVEVPSLQDGNEISSIAFDGQGRMYLAERGAATGDYFRYNLANGGASRVMRYVRKLPGDPAPGFWRLVPEQYSVGMLPPYANANGGVALSFGYDQDNVVDFASCGATVWSTGERLLDPGDPSLPPESFPNIDGLQGNAAGLIQPQNTPPVQSWFVDYDDLNGDPNYHGHMGAVATLPCPGQPAVVLPPPPPPPPPVSCPPGTYFSNGQCIIIPTCPPGTYYENGKCFYDDCPSNYIFENGQCKPPPVLCPPGTFYYQGQCFPINCPPGLVKQPNGQCVCPPGNVFFNGKCVPPQNCPPGMIQLPGGVCWCPLGTIFDDGLCQPDTCPPGQIWQDGFCKPCPNGKDFWNGKCVPKCPPGQVHLGPNGLCGPGGLIPGGCPPGQEKWKGQCVPKCGFGKIHKEPNGACGIPDIGVPCPAGQEKWNGQCVPKCPQGQQHFAPNGQCGPGGLIPGFCPPGQEKWKGQCVPKCGFGKIHKEPDGACGIPDFGILCPAGQEKWNGKCVPKCPAGKFHSQPNGACVGFGVIPDLKIPGIGGACAAPKQMVNGQCVDPCPPGQIRNNAGVCIKLGIVPGIKIPGLIKPLPPAPKPLVPPPVINPGLLKPPVIKLPTQPVPPPAPPQATPPKPPVVIIPGIQKPPVIKLPQFKVPVPQQPAPQVRTPPTAVTPPTLVIPQFNLPGLVKKPQVKTAPPPPQEVPPPAQTTPEVAPVLKLPMQIFIPTPQQVR